MKKSSLVGICLMAGLAGCAAGDIHPGATLLGGLLRYRSDIQGAGGSVSRWPARQQAAGDLKTVIANTVGASPEFFRLVDLDLRKREFTIAMRETSLRPERLAEMKAELVEMDEEIAALKPVVKTQLTAVSAHERGDSIENVAALGLLGIAVDVFSGGSRPSTGEAPTARVGQNTVTDFGSFSTVRTAAGQVHRCTLFSAGEEGSGIRCDAAR
jgi:hypothetical protein